MARPTLYRHPKFINVQLQLDENPAHVLGYLTMIWEAGWESGNPIIGSRAVVERLAHWPGEPGRLCQALLNASCEDGVPGFIEEVEGRPGVYAIHDFWDHAPEYVKDRKRKEDARKAKGALAKNGKTEPEKAVVREKSDFVREKSGNVPDKVGQSPDISGKSPKKSDLVPESSGQNPEMSGKSPTLSGKSLKKSDTPAPTPAPAPAHAQKESLSRGGVFCMGDSVENSSPPQEISNLDASQVDSHKAQEVSRRIVEIYRSKVNPESLPRYGEKDVLSLLTGAFPEPAERLIKSIENFAKFRLKFGPKPPYAPHASKFFQDRLWEAYADGVPDFAPIASNAKPEALKSKSVDLEKMLQDTREVSARQASPTKA